jgi:hypothetical protein
MLWALTPGLVEFGTGCKRSVFTDNPPLLPPFVVIRIIPSLKSIVCLWTVVSVYYTGLGDWSRGDGGEACL